MIYREIDHYGHEPEREGSMTSDRACQAQGVVFQRTLTSTCLSNRDSVVDVRRSCFPVIYQEIDHYGHVEPEQDRSITSDKVCQAQWVVVQWILIDSYQAGRNYIVDMRRSVILSEKNRCGRIEHEWEGSMG